MVFSPNKNYVHIGIWDCIVQVCLHVKAFRMTGSPSLKSKVNIDPSLEYTCRKGLNFAFVLSENLDYLVEHQLPALERKVATNIVQDDSSDSD